MPLSYYLLYPNHKLQKALNKAKTWGLDHVLAILSAHSMEASANAWHHTGYTMLPIMYMWRLQYVSNTKITYLKTTYTDDCKPYKLFRELL